MKAGKIIKYCFVAFAVFVLAVLGFHIFMNSDRSALSDVYPTESAKEAYAKYGEDAFVSFNLPDEMSHDGYITAYSPAYCEKTGEYQITVRYNDSLPENYLVGSDTDKYYFELTPGEKYNMLREIIAKSKSTMYVGDGINDTPSLAGADVGVAMGTIGQDAAIEAADIVIMSDSLDKLPEAIAIARKTINISWQNIIFALGVKGLILLLGLCGFANMWLAVFADVGVAVLAILNSMRALSAPKSK